MEKIKVEIDVADLALPEDETFIVDHIRMSTGHHLIRGAVLKEHYSEWVAAQGKEFKDDEFYELV